MDHVELTKAGGRVTKMTLPRRTYEEPKRRAAELFEAGTNANAVAALIGFGPPTVYGWLRRWREGGLDRLLSRPATYAPHVLSELETQVLDGLMLGDGCLWLGRNSRNACLTITRQSRDLGYLSWTAEIFASRIPESGSGIRVRDIFDRRTGSTNGSAVMRTRCDAELQAQHERWYPNGTKVIPKDLVLDAQSIAVWFADDASVSRSSRRSPEIKFATHSFTETEVHRLADILISRYDGKFPVYKESGKEQYTIRAYGAPAKALLRDIDPVFPPLSRKSDRWRTTELLDERTPPPHCPRCSSPTVYRHARSSKGVQQFKCLACARVFRETYERAGRDPNRTRGAAA
jgi:transposase